jgi:hypothetical protein
MLSAYLDGEVTAAERHEVTRHLEACRECRALLDDFRTMAEASAGEPPPPIPAGMAARIVSALETPARPARRPFFWSSPMPLAAAAGLLVILAGAWVISRRGMDRPPEVLTRALPESPAPRPGTADDATAPRERQMLRLPEDGAAREARPRAAEPHAEPAEPRAKPAAPRSEQDEGVRGLLQDTARREAEAQTDRLAAARAPADKDFAAPPDAEKALEAPPSPPPPPTGAAAAGHEPRAIMASRARDPRMDGRSLVFRLDGEEGTLWESGRVRLVWDQGTCSADLSSDAAVLEEVRSIFRLASAAPGSQGEQRADAAPEGAARPEAKTLGEGTIRSQVRSVRLLSPTSQPIALSNAETVEERLRRLLDANGRPLIEEGCGVRR